MMAASARMVGTVEPSAAVRKSGVDASRYSRAFCEARARARRARRARDDDTRGALTARRVRCARRVPIVVWRAAEMAAVFAAARVAVAASTSEVESPEEISARDAARPNRRKDRIIGTANTPFSETIIGILAEKP